MTQDLSNRSLPCDKPQVPRMKLLDERIESFCSWPHHLVRPSKQHMAMAGFFYEGKDIFRFNQCILLMVIRIHQLAHGVCVMYILHIVLFQDYIM